MFNFYLYFFEFGAVLAFLAILWKERHNKEMAEKIFLAFLYGAALFGAIIPLSFIPGVWQGILNFLPFK